MSDDNKISLLQAGFKVNDQSLLFLEPLGDWEVRDTDWVFFSSVNGVKFFEDNAAFPESKYGCIGHKTAEYLREKGIDPQFVGQGIDMEKIGRSFLELCHGETVGFYGSNQSRRFLQNFISKDCVVYDMGIYESRIASKPIDPADYYLFTSSLNVDAFFKVNQVPLGAEVWAIGEVTKSSLAKYGINKVHVPPQSDIRMMVQSILDSNRTVQ